MNRQQRRQRARIMRLLRADISRNGIGSMLDRIFGPGSWRYDAREHLWIVPDSNYQGPGRAYYCVRANGDWFQALLGPEHTQ